MRSVFNRYKSLLPHYRDTPEKRYLKITTILIVGCIVLMILISVVTFLIKLDCIRGHDSSFRVSIKQGYLLFKLLRHPYIIA